MNATVYSTVSGNGTIYAAEDMIFGWCIAISAEGFDPHYKPLQLKYGYPFDISQLDALLQVFAGPLYPQELRDQITQSMQELEKQIEENKLRFQKELQNAAANAVAPVEVTLQEAQAEIKKLRYNQRRGLSRLAIAYLHRLQLNPRLTSNVRITRIIAFLQDMAFDLELREHGPAGRFLTLDDCPVTVKKPNSQELIELLDGFIPFSK